MRIWISFVSVALSLVGCRENQKPHTDPAETTSGAVPVAEITPPPAAPPAGGPSGAQALQPEVREEAFVVKVHAPASAAVGTPFAFTVTLEAQAGYKVNQEYPIKFTFDPGTFSAEPAVLRKEQGEMEEKKAELKGSVRLGGAGSTVVSGKLAFSVCTDERCLIEKRDLSVSVVGS